MQCSQCKWFVDSGNAWDHSGACRRFPPVFIKHERDTAAFPKTTSRAYCGEFAEKQKKKPGVS